MYTIVDLCLLCLSNNEKLKCILSEDQDGILIEKKLRYFLLLTVELGVSKRICLHCLENLNHVYNFKQRCLRNIVKLNTYIQTLKTKTETCTNLEVKLIDIKSIHNVIEKINYKQDDTETENMLPDEPRQLDVDKEMIKKDDNFVRKENEEIFDNVTEIESITKVDTAAMIIDDEIEYELLGEIVKQEVENIHEEIDIKSETYEEIQNETTIDPEFIPTLNTNQRRTKDQDKEKRPYRCFECNQKFKRRWHLIQHTRTHAMRRSLTCKICGMAFFQQRSFKRHSQVHSGEKSHPCDMCEKSFNRTSMLVNHKRTHTGEKPFECDVCNKDFSQHSNLMKHKRIHTGEKPYKCDVCKAAYSDKSNFRTHLRLHTGEKPYKCEVCDKTFTQKNNLRMHRRARHPTGATH